MGMLPDGSGQTHLRRYLTTLGVAVAAGTLSLAGLFLKLQEDLLVTRSTLTQLTPTARKALPERERYLAWGTWILPWFVAAGVITGLGLASYGLIGWARRQKVTDALEDLALRRSQVEVRRMTVDEQDEKLNREAEESAVAIARADTPVADPAIVLPSESLVSSVRNRAMILEVSLRDKLKNGLAPQAFRTDIRFDGPTGRAEVDALADWKDYTLVFELKYTATIKNARNRISDALAQVDRGVRALRRSKFLDAKKYTQGAVVIVLDDSVDDDNVIRIQEFAQQATESFELKHRVMVIRYSEFLSLVPGQLLNYFVQGFPEFRIVPSS
jgi:hypothetical protein